MSYYKRLHLVCDDCGYEYTLEDVEERPRIGEVRDLASRDGWVTSWRQPVGTLWFGGWGDYCPPCVEKRRAP